MRVAVSTRKVSSRGCVAERASSACRRRKMIGVNVLLPLLLCCAGVPSMETVGRLLPVPSGPELSLAWLRGRGCGPEQVRQGSCRSVWLKLCAGNAWLRAAAHEVARTTRAQCNAFVHTRSCSPHHSHATLASLYGSISTAWLAGSTSEIQLGVGEHLERQAPFVCLAV